MKQRSAVLLMLGLLPWAVPLAQQQSTSATFKVTATVKAVCEVTARDLAFGTYTSQTSDALRGSATLSVTCTPNSTYNIGLNEGTSPSATINQRRMVSGSQVLNYQLYSDEQRSTIWGNTVGTNTVTDAGSGLAKEHTVFGAVPAAQVIPAGEYQDTITVRIYF